MPLFNTGKTAILNALKGTTSINASTIGLSTTAPNADGTNITEPVGGSYARVNYGGNMDSPVDDSVTNDEIIYFPETTGSWGTVTHFILYAGNTPIMYGALTAPVDIPSGYVPLIRVGALVLTVAGS